MIMYGAITMLVGTVRIALFHARMLVLLINLARAGHPHERDDSRTAVRWTNCDWNCKTRFDILCYVYLVLESRLQGNGFNSSSIPVYQAETCGGMVRGTLVCLNSTVTIIGLVIVSIRFKSHPEHTHSELHEGVLARLWHVLCRRPRSMASSHRIPGGICFVPFIASRCTTRLSPLAPRPWIRGRSLESDSTARRS